MPGITRHKLEELLREPVQEFRRANFWSSEPDSLACGEGQANPNSLIRRQRCRAPGLRQKFTIKITKKAAPDGNDLGLRPQIP
jgi:hypothetical protein